MIAKVLVQKGRKESKLHMHTKRTEREEPNLRRARFSLFMHNN